MASLLQHLASGLVFGSIVLLGSVGLTMLYGIGNFANFAHGELLAVGAYLYYTATVTMGLPALVGGGVAILGGAVLGVGLDRTLFARHRRSPPIVLLIVTLGLALLLRSLLRIIFSTSQRSLGGDLQLPITLIDETVSIGGYDLILATRLTPDAITIFVLGLIFAFLVHILLTRTQTGVAMRATSANMSLAKVTGINTDYILTMTWAISAVLAVVAGIFLAQQTGILYPRMGFKVLLVIFAAVILGGIGNPYGAMIGAYIIGVSQSVTGLIPGVHVGYRFAIAFAIMILVLLVRPKGIMGGDW